jgi:hypothetical protein
VSFVPFRGNLPYNAKAPPEPAGLPVHFRCLSTNGISHIAAKKAQKTQKKLTDLCPTNCHKKAQKAQKKLTG